MSILIQILAQLIQERVKRLLAWSRESDIIMYNVSDRLLTPQSQVVS